MSVNWMKPWLMLFFALSGTVMFNLFFLQSGRDPSIARHRAPYVRDRVFAEDALPSAALGAATGPRLAAATPASSDETSDLIRAIQRELGSRGYETGGSDGVPGVLTRAAIMAYEHDHDMPLTGEASESLLQAILFGRHGTAAHVAGAVPARGQAERIVRLVQQQLQGLGYPVLSADGRVTEATERAIRAFETAQGMPVTGRISGQLVARLGRQPAAAGRVASGR